MRIKKITHLLFLATLLYWVQPNMTGLAHDGSPPAAHDFWAAWNWEPTLLLGLGLAGWIYGQGLRSLWRRAGQFRTVLRRKAILFTAGWLVLFTALISPIDTWSGSLFSAHMVQHMLIVALASPLLVAGTPAAVLAWALPVRWRASLRGWRLQTGLLALEKVLTHPGFIWVLYAGTVWLWHLPGPYQAAVRNEWLHALEHTSFLGSSLLFWGVVARFSRREHGYAAAVLYLFTTALQGGLLGSLITFSASAWYPIHSQSGSSLTALEDQQLAGVIMWIPSGIVYLGSALGILGARLMKIEHQEGSYELPPMPPPFNKRGSTHVSK